MKKHLQQNSAKLYFSKCTFLQWKTTRSEDPYGCGCCRGKGGPAELQECVKELRTFNNNTV